MVESVSIQEEGNNEETPIDIEESISDEVDVDAASLQEATVSDDVIESPQKEESPEPIKAIKKKVKRPRSRSRTIERKADNIIKAAISKRGRPTKNVKVKPSDTEDLIKELEKKDQRPVIIQQTVEFPAEIKE